MFHHTHTHLHIVSVWEKEENLKTSLQQVLISLSLFLHKCIASSSIHCIYSSLSPFPSHLFNSPTCSFHFFSLSSFSLNSIHKKYTTSFNGNHPENHFFTLLKLVFCSSFFTEYQIFWFKPRRTGYIQVTNHITLLYFLMFCLWMLYAFLWF